MELETNKYVKEYTLITLDVWGNVEDGFEVNNIFKTDYSYHISYDMQDEEILDLLIQDDILADKAKEIVEIEWLDADYAEIRLIENGKPLLHLRAE